MRCPAADDGDAREELVMRFDQQPEFRRLLHEHYVRTQRCVAALSAGIEQFGARAAADKLLGMVVVPVAARALQGSLHAGCVIGTRRRAIGRDSHGQEGNLSQPLPQQFVADLEARTGKCGRGDTGGASAAVASEASPAKNIPAAAGATTFVFFMARRIFFTVGRVEHGASGFCLACCVHRPVGVIPVRTSSATQLWQRSRAFPRRGSSIRQRRS